MLVDWVRIEQRTSASVAGTNQGTNPDFICIGEQETYKVEGGVPLDSIIGWTVSPNLEIVSVSPLKDMVTVTPKSSANSYPGPGWVEVNTRNWPSSCFGHNIKKNVWVGNPATPIVSAYKTCNFISLNIDNYSSDNTYLWEVLTPGFPSSVFNNGKNLNITVSPPTQQPVPIAYRLTATNPCGNTIITTVVFTLPCNKWQINIFPNPANEVVNMDLVNFTQDELNQNLVLYLIDGNFNFKKSIPVTQFTESMEVFDVEPGNHYIFTVVNGENVISSQFIIQH